MAISPKWHSCTYILYGNGLPPLLLLVYMSWAVTVSQKAVSLSAECTWYKPPLSFVRGKDSTMWDIVWVSPQGHGKSVSHHFFLQTPQCPYSMRKRFSRDHRCQERSSTDTIIWYQWVINRSVVVTWLLKVPRGEMQHVPSTHAFIS